MSISAYVGLPGHGKSYGAVEHVIIPALKMGRVVYTNIPMNSELLINDFGSAPIQFLTSDVQKNPNWFTEVFQAGSVLVFDELWRLWPSGLKANQVLEQHKTFLAEHRHYVGENGHATEIYFVTQDLSQVANFARALVETTYRMVKRLSLGFSSLFRVDIYEGAVTGSKPPESKLVRQIHDGKYSEKIWKYYQSHTKSANGLAGNETRVDKRNNAFGRTSIKLGFLFFCIALPLIYFGFKKVKEKYAPHEPVKVQPVSAAPQSPVSPVAKPKKITPDFLSKSKSVFYSHSIKTNAITELYFSIEFDDSYAVLSMRDLVKLGYKVLPFGSCIYLVEGQDYNDYVMCRSSRKTAGFIKSAISGEDS